MPLLPSERDQVVWDQILTNLMHAQSFVTGHTFEAFAADKRTNYAVVRCLEILSEASRRASPDARARHPEIEWRAIADGGNHYRHGYHEVRLDIVWRTVHERLPDLPAAARVELDRPPGS